MLRGIDINLKMEALSPLAMAYIGDAVYELYVRIFWAADGSGKMKDLHQQVVSNVKAGAQASFLKKLEPMLTQEEQAIVRWGRNAKSGHVPKNADVLEYRHSTGFEALIGHLYLKGQDERLKEILRELSLLMNDKQVGML